MFLEISQNSQENTCVRGETLAQVFSCEFCEILSTPFLQNASGRLLPDLEKNDENLAMIMNHKSKLWTLSYNFEGLL